MTSKALDLYRRLIRSRAPAADWPRPWGPAPRASLLAARGMSAPRPPWLASAASLPTRGPAVVSHAFDDGAPVTAVVRRGASGGEEYDLGPGAFAAAAEYDVAIDNPGFVPPREAVSAASLAPARPAPVTPRPPAPPVRPLAAAEASATSPPSAGGGRWPSEPVPERHLALPVAPVAAAGDRDEEPPLVRSASTGDFTARELRGLIRDDDLFADIQSILSGGAEPPPPAPPPAVASAREQSVPAAPPAESHNEHEIFDKIAENMRYATAYNLGTVELEQRFDELDRLARDAATLPLARARPAQDLFANPGADSA